VATLLYWRKRPRPTRGPTPRRGELLQLLLADDHLDPAWLAMLADVQTALLALAEVADDELGAEASVR
jgi:hypothetical protein